MRIGDRGVAVGHAKEGKNRIMNNRHCLTALVTIGALLGAAGSAAADPYADETVSVERVESPDGTYNTNDDKVKSVKDRGNEALGAPNWNAYNVWGRATVLGFDPVTGIGGNAVLAFTDNICLNGPGPDLQSTTESPVASRRSRAAGSVAPRG